MNRLGWAATLAALMCAPVWGKSFKEQDTLEPGEGILATTVTCGHPITGIQLFDAGKSSGGFWGPLKSSGSLGCLKEVQLIRLKAGKYYVGQVYSAGNNLAVPEAKSVQFTVEAGKVNYGGDLYVGNVSMNELDQETLLRVIGKNLVTVNHEPQARDALMQRFASVLARYSFVADTAMGPPVAMGEVPKGVSGQMRGTMSIGASRWKRAEDGQPRICTKSVPIPKGTKLPPGEDMVCDGEYITPEAYVEKEYPNAVLGIVTPREGDNSALLITFTASPPER